LIPGFRFGFGPPLVFIKPPPGSTILRFNPVDAPGLKD
jgi:hypothetical protein